MNVYDNSIKKFGENSYGDTPGHISNPEVKPVNAESTWGAAPWEDRNLPNFFYFLKIITERVHKYAGSI